METACFSVATWSLKLNKFGIHRLIRSFLGFFFLSCLFPSYSLNAQDRPVSSVEQVTRLDETNLAVLERRLNSEIDRIRKNRAPEAKPAPMALDYNVHGRTPIIVPLPHAATSLSIVELQKVTQDIMNCFSKGIGIGSQVESRPLLPLLKEAGVSLAPEWKVDHEQMGYDFYWVEVVFSCFLEKDQFPKSAEFALTLEDDVKKPARRTRPIRLFPDREDIQLFSMDIEGGIGVDASFNFRVPKVQSKISPFSREIQVEAKIKAGIVIGPYKYKFRRAAIEVKGLGDQDILWRYNLQSALCGANDFKSILILKVPKEADSVFIVANLKLTPCKNAWLPFKNELPFLQAKPARLQVELAKKKK
ncbi:MAG: hypothetical protein FJ135_14145 [Deltaproteobacteria bacterium]|nr:hypothetical protein [Deltaproteobacteria bacterium]